MASVTTKAAIAEEVDLQEEDDVVIGNPGSYENRLNKSLERELSTASFLDTKYRETKYFNWTKLVDSISPSK